MGQAGNSVDSSWLADAVCRLQYTGSIAVAGDVAGDGQRRAGAGAGRISKRAWVAAAGDSGVRVGLGDVGDGPVPAAPVEFLSRRGSAAAVCRCAGTGADLVSAFVSLCAMAADVRRSRAGFGGGLASPVPVSTLHSFIIPRMEVVD